MIKCYVPARFEVKPKGWLSRMLLELGFFRHTITLWDSTSHKKVKHSEGERKIKQ